MISEIQWGNDGHFAATFKTIYYFDHSGIDVEDP